MTPGTHRCRACAADVPDGAPRCERCGAPQGDLPACPHCNGHGGISRHEELRFACDLCGGPRIPWPDASIPASRLEEPFLRKADTARKARATWRGAAAASGLALVFTAVPFLLLLFVIGAAPLLMIPGVLFTALFAGLLAVAVRRARAAAREITPALDGAWIGAATEVSRSCPEPLTAAYLSEKLGIEEPLADELLALLDVQEAISAPPSAGPRARVGIVTKPMEAAKEPAAALAQAAEQAAEEEAAADDAAAAERKKL